MNQIFAKNMRDYRLIPVLMIVLVLAQSILARERQGGTVQIVKNDGTTITGELIAVKKNSLILAEKGSVGAMSIYINFSQIKDLNVQNKRQIVGGVMGGILVGTVFGFFIAGATAPPSRSGWGPNFSELETGVKGAFIGALLGMGIGGISTSISPTKVQLMESGHRIVPEAEFFTKLRSIAALPDAY